MKPPEGSAARPATRTIVIGGGAAGMMAAGRAAELGASVLLLERTPRLGNKIRISGKTRCNLTNTAPLDEFLEMYGPNGRFLQGPFRRFFREELLELLARFGLHTKAERGGRIFPQSDDAGDVVSALERYMARGGVEVRTGARVNHLLVEQGQVCGVRVGREVIEAGSVIVATGGASYPATGSTGDGYDLAREVGHTVTPLRPALVPLKVEEVQLARTMQGVSLKNVRLTAFHGRADQIDPALAPRQDTGRGLGSKRARPPVIESRMGEMMLTHFGIGGPITLLMSLAVVDALQQGSVSVAIDLKPALTPAELRQRLQREFDQHGRRGLRRIMEELLPSKMIQPLLALSEIAPQKPGHQVTAQERDRLAGLLKCLRFNIAGPLSLSAAIVTAGGVSLKEVDPRTMESRLVRGLHFAGEVLDLDADTGGYNLQAAFTTGHIAGGNQGQSPILPVGQLAQAAARARPGGYAWPSRQ